MQRSYNRANNELRPITIERNYTKHAHGSVLVSFGDTKVICTAFVENRLPPWLRDSGRGWITAEYGMLPGATSQRGDRESIRKGRSQEISRLIGRSLRVVFDLGQLGECQVTVDCDVIQADGGTRTASITGGFVAVYDALESSVGKGFLKKIPVIDICAAVSVGWVNNEYLLDLDYFEDAQATVDMNFVMNSKNELIEIQGSGEHGTFTREQLNKCIDLAECGIQQVIEIQKKVIGWNEK
ncbi:MAG TPA: ribonuclease PH [Candidatus Hydrogenedens sp.]|nr:ribonuclease PH [Candidatus Hydrogenedens sp.]